MRVLELFAGIGGCAAAVAGRAEIVAAVDHDPYAHTTYTHNHPHAAHRWNVMGLRPDRLARLDADLWWMSPPCQPFTVRGARRDLDDPRCQPLLKVLDLVDAVRPTHLAMENVPAFEGSRAHALVRDRLAAGGYRVRERQLCPGALGVPNKRPRFYLLASQERLPDWAPLVRRPRPLAVYLDPAPDPSSYVPEALLARYGDALAVTDLDHPEPQTHCFTAAYRRSPVYAGSYVRDGGGVRWLSPDEILRLLHFPQGFRFPDEVPLAKRYKLVGNSLSVAAVAEVLAPLLPTGAPPPSPG